MDDNTSTTPCFKKTKKRDHAYARGESSVKLDDEAPAMKAYAPSSRRTRIKTEPPSLSRAELQTSTLSQLPSPRPSASVKSEDNGSQPISPSYGIDLVGEQNLKLMDGILEVLSMLRTDLRFDEAGADEVMRIAMQSDAYRPGTKPGLAALAAARQRNVLTGRVDSASLDYTLHMIRERIRNHCKDWAKDSEDEENDDDSASEASTPSTPGTNEASDNVVSGMPGSCLPEQTLLRSEKLGSLRDPATETKSGTVGQACKEELSYHARTDMKVPPGGPAADAQVRRHEEMRKCRGDAWVHFFKTINRIVRSRSLPMRGQSWSTFKNNNAKLWQSLSEADAREWNSLCSSGSASREEVDRADALFRRQHLMKWLEPSIQALESAVARDDGRRPRGEALKA